MNFTKKEKKLIQFLYDYKLYCEIENKETENIHYLNSINGDFKEMFESTQLLHNDERLSIDDSILITNIYQKLKTKKL